jgi:ATP-dependent Clp protease ATP-binding subunit ClpX
MFYLQVDLTFSPGALNGIAQQAMERKTGARGLRAIMVNTYLNYFDSNVTLKC